MRLNYITFSCKTAVTPLLMHWIYYSFALSHCYYIYVLQSQWKQKYCHDAECSNASIHYVNSLAPWKFALNFRHVIFKQILVIDGWGISCEMALIWMSLDLTDDQSRLVGSGNGLVPSGMNQYLSQCWPRSMSPNGVTGPQWVNISFPDLLLGMVLGLGITTTECFSMLGFSWQIIPPLSCFGCYWPCVLKSQLSMTLVCWDIGG